METHHPRNLSVKPLYLGLFFSLILTFGMYLFSAGTPAPLPLLGIATLQAVIQLFFFLHLDVEENPRWNLMMFLFMVFTIIILVGGSLWIMANLDYNTMPMMDKLP